MLATLAVATGILLIQLTPFNFTTRNRGSLLALTHNTYLSLALQAALFIPLGLTEGMLCCTMFGRRGLALVVMLVDVALLALVCETAHHFLPERCSSMIDLTACTLGGVAGLVLLITVQDLGGNGSDEATPRNPV